MLEFLKNLKTFLNEGTQHEKNYMKGLNSKNENIKGGGFPENNVFQLDRCSRSRMRCFSEIRCTVRLMYPLDLSD